MDFYATITRHLLNALGVYMMSHGLLDQGQVDTAIGAILTLGAVGYAAIRNYRSKKVPADAVVSLPDDTRGSINQRRPFVWLLIFGTALAFHPEARAADMPVKSVATLAHDWSGFFVGINGGLAYARTKIDFESQPGSGIQSAGPKIGASVGANWQSGAMVFGIVVDGDWLNVKGDVVCPSGVCLAKNTWFGDALVRVGAVNGSIAQSAFGTWIGVPNSAAVANGIWLYGVGGVVIRGLTVEFNGEELRAKKIGYAYGAGLEIPLTGQLSIGAEYLHVAYNKVSCACNAFPTDFRTQEDIVRARLNWKF